MNIQANDRKQINTAVLDHLFTQGEAGADVVSIHLPLRYGQADLAALVWSVQLVSEKDSFVSKALEKEVAEEELILRWMVEEDCTAVSGKVSVTVVGVSEDGGTVIKFDGNRIFIKEAAYGSFAPTPDTMAAALLQVQKAAEEAASAAKSANEDAQAAQESASRSPYIGEDGFWYVFDGESGMYQKSDIAAVGPAGPAGPKGDPGGVLTVNGQTPDSSGNVNVQAGVTSVFGREGAVTAQPGDYNISQITGAVRPNLLDNWYFGNPVNQRGQTEYNGAEYTVDRWKKTTSDGAVTMTAGGITATNEAGAGTLYLSQYLGGFDLRNFDCVFSVLTENGLFLTKQVDAIGSQDETPFGYLRIGWSESANCSFVQIQITQGNTANILAAKLELGEGQTLAHQDADGNWVLNEIPDYAEELAKCQRYFVRIKNEGTATGFIGTGVATSTNGTICVLPLPVSMRAAPALSGWSGVTFGDGGSSDTTAATSVEAIAAAAPYNTRPVVIRGTSTRGDAYVIFLTAGGYLDFSADL